MNIGLIISLLVTWILLGTLIGMSIYLKKKDWHMFLLVGIVLSALIIILGWIDSVLKAKLGLAFWLPLGFYAIFLIWFYMNYVRPSHKKVKKQKHDKKKK